MSIHLVDPSIFRAFCRCTSPEASTRRYRSADCDTCRLLAVQQGHTDTEGITAADQVAIERAAAHAASEGVLEPAARWPWGVTDLDVARVMRALEGGMRPERDKMGRWRAPAGSPIGPQLSPVLKEMVRTGLVVDLFGTPVPAPVHLAAWDMGRVMRITACGVPGENMGPKRVRLHTWPMIVDCPRCITLL